MEFDPVLLARIQFAFTISFHIIFPAFTIGLSAYVTVLLLLWLKTGDEKFHRLARFWTKIFAVSFAMGVVSGIVLSYQFGTNWSRFSEFAGNIVGPLMGYEVLTAFYLEATFLGIMLFGWNRVPPWLLALSSFLVAFGTATSAFWILAANSWMQTPAGHEIRDGVAVPVDWLQVIFNPSFFYRLPHMLTAAYLTTAVVVLGVGARYLLARQYTEDAKTMLRMAVGMIAVTAPLQLFIGDQHGLNTLQHQPMKVAAMEGNWNTATSGDLVLFGIPSEREQRNLFEIAIPHAGSLILTHSMDGKYPGLNEVPPEERPPVANVFFAFRIMVGIGLLLIATGLAGVILWWRGRLFTTRWFLTGTSYMWPLGFTAIIAGWFVTEQGRQPWLVHNLLKTADGISPVPGASVFGTLILFLFIYGAVFSTGIYYINRLITKGPKGALAAAPAGLPNRPISAVEDAAREATGKNKGQAPGRSVKSPPKKGGR
jgi:cytochrome d ubiquinol oxidase subunit I